MQPMSHDAQLAETNKKLRYREEHNLVGVLYDISQEKMYQPLLRNWPRKLPNSAK